MAITVLQSDTFDEWRIKTNEIASTIASDSFIAGQIADMVNGSNTENGISVSFDPPTATLNFDVDDFTLSSAEEACQAADLCVMLVKHDQFCALDKKLQPFHIKLDFCGLLQVSHNQV